MLDIVFVRLRTAILAGSIFAFALFGLAQPIIISRQFGFSYWSIDGFGYAYLLKSMVFFISFPILLFATQWILNRFFGDDGAPRTFRQWFNYILTADRPTSTSVFRAIFSVGLLFVALKHFYWIDSEGFLFDSSLSNELMVSHKLIDRFISIDGWRPELVFAAIVGAFFCSLFGLFSRISFLVLFLSALLLNSWYEALRPNWSHGEIPILMGAFPLLFTSLRGRYALDNRFLPKTSSPYLPLYFTQVFVALFYVGAFFAKMLFGGYQWVVSDHLTNSLTLAWHNAGVDLAEPFYISLFENNALFHFAAAYGHLFLQLLPALALVNVASAGHKAFESVVYAFGAVMLWAMMGFIWPWYWWLGVALVFIDFDKIAGTATVKAPTPLISVTTGFGLIPLAIAFYTFGFLTQLPARSWQLYPFLDALSFYALPYSKFPYRPGSPFLHDQAGIIRGDFRCATTSDCIDSLRLKPVNKNSPVFRNMPLAAPTTRETFIRWCADKPISFCGVSAASERGDWLGTWAGTFKAEPNGASRTLKTLLAGATTVRSPTGRMVSVSSEIDGQNIRITMVSSDGKPVDIVSAQAISPDLTKVQALPDQPQNGALTIENYQQRNICAVTVVGKLQPDVLFPFYVGDLCSWRGKT